MKPITRREAIQLAGTTVIAGQLVGCAAVAQAGRIIVSVPWSKVIRIVSAVVLLANRVLSVTAALAGEEKSLEEEKQEGKTGTRHLDKKNRYPSP